MVNKGGQQVKKIARQIIRDATEDIYNTPFIILGNFYKKKFVQVKRELL